MRSLLLLAIRYHALLLFLALETLALILVFNFNSFQRATFLHQSQELVGAVHESSNELVSFFKMGKYNNALNAQNAALQDSLHQVLTKKRQAVQMTVLDTVASDSLPKLDNNQDTLSWQLLPTHYAGYQFIPAELVQCSYHKRLNYFTINKGSSDQIAAMDGIVGNKGIVGVVQNVSENYAAGLTVLHAEFNVSAKILELNEVGLVTWQYGDHRRAFLEQIPRHVDVKEGQQVVVSHLSYTFPENTPIGIITKVEKPEGSPFLRLEITLHEDLRNTQYVYAVRHVDAVERRDLEQMTIKE